MISWCGQIWLNVTFGTQRDPPHKPHCVSVVVCSSTAGLQFSFYILTKLSLLQWFGFTFVCFLVVCLFGFTQNKSLPIDCSAGHYNYIKHVREWIIWWVDLEFFFIIHKNKTCVALKRACSPLRFRTCRQSRPCVINRCDGRGRCFASSALRTQKKTRHSSVAVLRRHALNDDVIVERHRFRVEWELAVFPIFWSFNPWMAPKQDPKPKFQEGNGAPVWFGACFCVSFGAENGPKPPPGYSA